MVYNQFVFQYDVIHQYFGKFVPITLPLCINKSLSCGTVILWLPLFGTFIMFWMVYGVHGFMASVSTFQNLVHKVWRYWGMWRGGGEQARKLSELDCCPTCSHDCGGALYVRQHLQDNVTRCLEVRGAAWTNSWAAFTPRRRCWPETRRSTSNTKGKRLVPF